VDRNVVLTLAGIAMGITIAVLWLPPPAPPARPEPVIERWSPPFEPVPPGRRGVVVHDDGTRASFVDVHLTERFGWGRIYRAVRTNHEGHFPILVPPGRYRVQGLFIDHEIFIPSEPGHPDIEVRVVPEPLLKFLVHPD
jgi:hypothetical protein